MATNKKKNTTSNTLNTANSVAKTLAAKNVAASNAAAAKKAATSTNKTTTTKSTSTQSTGTSASSGNKSSNTSIGTKASTSYATNSNNFKSSLLSNSQTTKNKTVSRGSTAGKAASANTQKKSNLFMDSEEYTPFGAYKIRQEQNKTNTGMQYINKLINEYTQNAQIAARSGKYDHNSYKDQYSKITDYLNKYGNTMLNARDLYTAKKTLNNAYDQLQNVEDTAKNLMSGYSNTTVNRNNPQSKADLFNTGARTNSLLSKANVKANQNVQDQADLFYASIGGDLQNATNLQLKALQGKANYYNNKKAEENVSKAGKNFANADQTKAEYLTDTSRNLADRSEREEKLYNYLNSHGYKTSEEEVSDILNNEPQNMRRNYTVSDNTKKIDYSTAANRIQNELDNRAFQLKYVDLYNNDDWEENSSYDSASASKYKYLTWHRDYPDALKQTQLTDDEKAQLFFDSVNGDERAYDALHTTYTSDGTKVQLGTNGTGVEKYMSDDEVRNFTYLYNTEGKDSAMEYYSGIEDTLNQRLKEDTQAQLAEEVKDPLKAAEYSLLSVATQPFATAANLIMDASDLITKGSIDYNDPRRTYTQEGNVARSLISDEIKNAAGGEGTFLGDLASLGYEAGMSALDNLYGLGIGQKVSSIFGLTGTAANQTTENIVLGLMGTSSAASSIQSNLEAGMDTTSAITLGVGSGAIEVITEKIGMDNLFDSIWKGKTAWVSYAKQILSEGSEEVLGSGMNDALGLAYDAITGESKSDFNREINQYILENGLGMNAREEAFQHVLQNHIEDALMQGAAGGISGGMLGGFALANSLYVTNNTVNAINVDTSDTESMRAFAMSAIESSETGSKTNEAAQELLNTLPSTNDTPAFFTPQNAINKVIKNAVVEGYIDTNGYWGNVDAKSKNTELGNSMGLYNEKNSPFYNIVGTKAKEASELAQKVSTSDYNAAVAEAKKTAESVRTEMYKRTAINEAEDAGATPFEAKSMVDAFVNDGIMNENIRKYISDQTLAELNNRAIGAKNNAFTMDTSNIPTDTKETTSNAFPMDEEEDNTTSSAFPMDKNKSDWKWSPFDTADNSSLDLNSEVGQFVENIKNQDLYNTADVIEGIVDENTSNAYLQDINRLVAATMQNDLSSISTTTIDENTRNEIIKAVIKDTSNNTTTAADTENNNSHYYKGFDVTKFDDAQNDYGTFARILVDYMADELHLSQLAQTVLDTVDFDVADPAELAEETANAAEEIIAGTKPQEIKANVSNKIKMDLYNAYAKDIAKAKISSEAATLNINNQEENKNGRKLSVSGISRGNNVQNTGIQSGEMVSNSGRTQETGRIFNADARLNEINSIKRTGQRQTAYELGLTNGSKGTAVNIISNDSNADTKAAAQYAAQHGYSLVTFADNNLKFFNGKISARGTFNADTKTIYARGDHKSFNAQQITRHEIFHVYLSTNKEEKISRLLKNISNAIGKENLNAVMKMYDAAYYGSELTKMEVTEEMLCDFNGQMNIFSGVLADSPAVRETYNRLLEIVSGETENTTANAENQILQTDTTSTENLNTQSEYKFSRDLHLLSQLNDWMAGNGKKNGVYNGSYFDLGKTPSILVDHGAKNLKMEMSEDVVIKITGGKHSISLDEISKLPSQIENPILLFNGNAPKSFVVLTEILDKDGNDVIAAIHINTFNGRNRVNKIASLYAKSDNAGNNRIVNYVINQINRGNLIDGDIKKAVNWFTSKGLQLPELVQTILSADNNISLDKKNSKQKFSMETFADEQLTSAQREYFKDSKIRDKNGNLLKMYHGTPNAGFTVFDSTKSDDGISLFFTDNPAVARSYSGGKFNFLSPKNSELVANNSGQYAVYLNIKNPYIYDAKGLNWNKLVYGDNIDSKIVSFVQFYNMYKKMVDKWIGVDELIDDIISSNGKIVDRIQTIIDNEDFEDYSGSANWLPEDINNLVEAAQNMDSTYKQLYKNLPDSTSIGDFLSNEYEKYKTNKKKTRDIVKDIYNKGIYDGVVFKNIIDEGIYGYGDAERSTIAVAFDSNQVKSVTNENPTSDVDIRKSRELKFNSGQAEAIKEAASDIKLEGKKYSITTAEAKKIARDFIRDSGSTIKPDSIAADIQYLTTKITEEYSTFDDVKSELMPIAKKIVESASETDGFDDLQQIRNEIRSTKLFVSQKTRNDFTDYNEMRKSHFGSVSLSLNSGEHLSDFADEMYDAYGSVFDIRDMTESDQLRYILDFVDNTKAKKINPYEGQIEEATNFIAEQLYESMLNAKLFTPTELKNIDSLYAPDKWTSSLNRGSTKTAENIMPLSDIIAKIRHDFDINITKGYIRGKNTLGNYNTKTHGIRTKISNYLPTIVHELGHHLDNKYQMIPERVNDLPKNLVKELRKCLGDLGSAYQANEQPFEGLAEFLRKYMQSKDETVNKYPTIAKWLLGNLSGKDRMLVENFAEEINGYYALDDGSSVIRLAENGGKDFRTTAEKVKDKYSSLYRTWVDALAPLKDFDRAVGSDVYKAAIVSQYSDSVAGEIITGDLTDINGQYVAPGLGAALEGINVQKDKEYKDFGLYLVLKHAPEWFVDNKRVFADDFKNNEAWVNKRAAELEKKYPKFEQAAEKIYKFQTDLMNTWGIQTGIVDADFYKQLQEKYPKYVPMFRVKEKTSNTRSAKKGFANQSSPFKKAIGSGLDIIHPVDSIAANIAILVNAGKRNDVMIKLTNAATALGANANFMEKVATPMVGHKVFADTVSSGLKKNLNNIDISKITDMNEDSLKSIIDVISTDLVQFEKGRAKGNIVTVLKNGKQEFWKINDTALLDSVASLTPKKLDGLLNAYAKTTRFLTANITGNNPVWSIFSNAPRDLGTFIGYFPNKKKLGTALLSIGSAYVNSFKANKTKGTTVDPMYREYLAMGGGHTSMYSADTDLAKKARKTFQQTKAQRIWTMLNPLEWLSFLTDTIEQGPRYATYRTLRLNGMSQTDAFYEAMDITTNFRKAGTMSRTVNKVVPFFNASVQGVDKFARYFSAADVKPADRAKVVRARVGIYAAVSAAIAAIFYALNCSDPEKEKDYQQLSNYTKNNFWLFPMGDGKYFAIPKPRELAVPTSLFERVLETTAGDNNHAFDEFYGYAADNFLPSIVSDVAKLPEAIAEDGLDTAISDTVTGSLGNLGIIGVGVDLAANKDFLGRSIESTSLQNYEAKDRYTDATSWVAKALGQAFNLSPQKIDYAGNNILGYIWKIQKALFPVGASKRDLTLGVANSYVKDNLYSTDITNWMYDKADKSSIKANSNPDDADIQYTAKMDSNMTSFYGKFNGLNKGNESTTKQRAAKQTVADMLYEYQRVSDNKLRTDAEKAVIEVVKEEGGDTSNLPAVMNTYVQDAQKNQYNLTDAQYVEYQTTYNAEYWNYVESHINNLTLDDLKAAKSTAKTNATNAMLKSLLGNSESYKATYNDVTSTTKYKNASSTEKSYIEGLIDDYEIYNTKWTIAAHEAEDAGALTATEYILFMNALHNNDQPTEKGVYGTYTKEEQLKAIAELKWSDSKASRVWDYLQNSSNNPYTSGKTTAELLAKKTKTTTTQQKEKSGTLNSSFLGNYTYKNGVLNIEVSGKWYQYNVSEETFNGLVNSSSPGRYFNAYIG